MIRSSAHTLKFANPGKRQGILLFLTEYRRLLQTLVDDIWQNGIMDFSVAKNRLDTPAYLPNDYLKGFDSWFTARMKQCVGKQACAMVKAATKKRSKQLYMLKKLMREGKPTGSLQSKIDRQVLVRPDASNAKAELDPRFIDFQEDSTEFNTFARIKTIGGGMELRIPIRATRPSNKWSSVGMRKNSIRLSADALWLIYEVADVPKHQGATVGCDQGYKTVVTLSDGQSTMPCPHRHTLEAIQAKLARRKKGSNGFRRAQEHRKNYINWALNQINWAGIGEVRFEKVRQLRFKKHTSRQMSHWAYTIIRKKVESLSETEGFRFREVENAFRSQRCSQCGRVLQSNRMGAAFMCDRCGFSADADVNAATNLSLDLFEIPWWVQQSRINRQGFYWLDSGLFTDDHEPIVRDNRRAVA